MIYIYNPIENLWGAVYDSSEHKKYVVSMAFIKDERSLRTWACMHSQIMCCGSLQVKYGFLGDINDGHGPDIYDGSLNAGHSIRMARKLP